jgi:RNA-directed DNA polymerase
MYDTRVAGDIARALAGAFLTVTWDEAALQAAAQMALERRAPWTSAVIADVLRAYPRPPTDRPRELAKLIAAVLARLQAGEDDPSPPPVKRWLVPEATMAARRWPVPEIASVAALARFLELGDGDLAWLADTRGLERTAEDPRLRHYAYGTLPRRLGPLRVIERPKQRLKGRQRLILHEILNLIPVHAAAHGFTRGRSVRSHAGAHVDQFAVVRFDLKDFFASIAAARIYGIFRTAGYPESVAYALTGLTTNVVPATFWHGLPRPSAPSQVSAHHRLGRQLATPHLPQGAPTSPALANLAAFGLDRRLSGLAASLDLNYSRYADDLAFSGSARLMRAVGTLRAAVGAIVRDEGFMVNPDKTFVATGAGRQLICGVVVNKRTNIARDEYDTLKAMLHNAVLHGPGSQNRTGRTDFRAHLLGRISWVQSLNPERGAKLRRHFDQILWDQRI